MSEIWKDIPDVGTRFLKYQVSDQGNIRSVNYNNGRAKILKASLYRDNTRRIQLRMGDRKQSYNVATLVLRAFVPNPKKYHFIKHLNGVKTDDRAVNLQPIKCGDHIFGRVMKSYDIVLENGVLMAAGVKTNSPMKAILKWYHALSKVLDFERTFGTFEVRGKRAYLNDRELRTV